MKVLSLFDGISCARVALGRRGIVPELYLASEIDPHAVAITMRNWPKTVQLGDIRNVHWDPALQGELDLLIGGSPCQDLSVAKQGRKGLEGDRSKLFYEYVRILKEARPKWWILENVASMNRENRDAITKIMGVEPIMIDAALVSAQSRKRLFWTNIPGITQPEDRGILLKDIIVDGYAMTDKARTLTASYQKGPCIGNLGTHRERTMVALKPIRIGKREGSKGGISTRIYSIEGKSVALKALGGGGGAKTGLYQIKKGDVRALYPVECERLQSLPDGYTEGVAKTHRITALGNGFNVDVIAHILSHIYE